MAWLEYPHWDRFLAWLDYPDWDRLEAEMMEYPDLDRLVARLELGTLTGIGLGPR